MTTDDRDRTDRPADAPEADSPRELADLRRRLDRIEAHLGLPAVRTEQPASPEPTSAPSGESPPEAAAPPVAPPIVAPTHADDQRGSTGGDIVAAAESKAARFADRDAPPDRQPAERERGGSLEVAIGMKATAWLGAIAIIAGAGFLVKLGIDEGWWGAIPPALRAAGIALVGFAMIAAGELVMRRINRAAAAGVFSAALGVLYLDVYAMFQHFKLVNETAAFLLMGVVAVIGFAATLRSRLLAVGVVSLIGGYATPLLVGGEPGNDLLFGSYLTVLFALALALSAVKPTPFRPLRSVALGGQALLGFLWFASSAHSNAPEPALIFSLLWWGMTTGEAVLAAVRDQSTKSNCIVTLVATALFVTGGTWLLASAFATGVDWLGLFTFGIAAVSVAGAFMFGDPPAGLRGESRHAADLLGVSLVAQAGVLLVVAAAQQFDGFAESISWLAIGLAAIEIGRRLPSRGVDVFGLLVGGLAVGRIMLIDWWAFNLGTTVVYEGVGLEITKWTLLGLCAVAATMAAAFRIRPRPVDAPHWGRMVLAIIASAVFLLITGFSGESFLVNVLWLAGAAALLALAPYAPAQRFTAAALLVLLAFAGKTLLLDIPGEFPGSDRPVISGLAWINDVTICAVAAAGLASFAASRVRREIEEFRPNGSAAAQIVLMLAVGFLGLVFSHQIAIMIAIGLQPPFEPGTIGNVKLVLGLVSLWGLAGLVMMLLGVKERPPVLMMAGLVAFMLSTFVYLVYPTLYWRIDQGGPWEGPAIVNPTTGAGLALALAAIFAYRLLQYGQRWWIRGDHPTGMAMARHCGHGMAALASTFCLLMLWIGSFEIDRFFAADAMAAAAGISVYWGLVGVALVVIGFARFSAAARYAGLALLAVTLGKVVLFDLSNVDRIWRVLSFLASGALLVGTSIVYAKLSPRLLATLAERSASDRDEPSRTPASDA